MAVEAKRGCGFRKVGGIYLVCDGQGRGCGRLPLELIPCPTCGGGVRQTRGWTWIDPSKLFEDTQCFERLYDCDNCPAGNLGDIDRAGLLWVGKSFYKTPEHFEFEARSMGISRRIPAIPRGFEIGKHWVFLAHPEVVPGTNDEGDQVMAPAVFKIFKPTAMEILVTESEMSDDEEMDKLIQRGLTPIAVPDDDPDHARTDDDRE